MHRSQETGDQRTNRVLERASARTTVHGLMQCDVPKATALSTDAVDLDGTSEATLTVPHEGMRRASWTRLSPAINYSVSSLPPPSPWPTAEPSKSQTAHTMLNHVMSPASPSTFSSDGSAAQLNFGYQAMEDLRREHADFLGHQDDKSDLSPTGLAETPP
jgi:hypothetical protein